jgi:uroporphyrinogen-III synthase
MLVDVVVACIGPVTADAARAHDLPVRVVPAEHTLEGMVAGLVDYFKARLR